MYHRIPILLRPGQVRQNSAMMPEKSTKPSIHFSPITEGRKPPDRPCKEPPYFTAKLIRP